MVGKRPSLTSIWKINDICQVHEMVSWHMSISLWLEDFVTVPAFSVLVLFFQCHYFLLSCSGLAALLKTEIKDDSIMIFWFVNKTSPSRVTPVKTASLGHLNVTVRIDNSFYKGSMKSQVDLPCRFTWDFSLHNLAIVHFHSCRLSRYSDFLRALSFQTQYQSQLWFQDKMN